MQRVDHLGVADQLEGRELDRPADVVDAVAFLLENRSVDGVELDVDSGWLVL